jgi:hypothetical protein
MNLLYLKNHKGMYRKYLIYLFCISAVFCTTIFKGYSQDSDIPKDLYIAASIPDSLKENANSVIRYSSEEDIVRGPGKSTNKIHLIVTVLNEKADREAIMELFYNKKYDSYSDIIMRVYDDKGNVIKKYHKSDLNDYSATSGANLVTDERVLALKHTIASYPETIEIEYEEDVNSFFDIGEWNIQGDEQSVQNAYYRIVIDKDAGFRYLNKNTKIQPLKKEVDGKSEYSWEVKNLKAIKLEEHAQSWRVFPRVCFSSTKFNLNGYPGDISTWDNYGKWQKDLNADVCSLTPEREAEIRKMTDTIKTDKEKARFLYKYMQQNVRYVSIQLGIGGWKPFPATFVDQKKYGDCKALSNYMSALLKAVHIPSYYAVINAEANKEPADPSFPFDSFNHIILCIPFKNDTTWLECTSNITPFGKLGPFTENRNALIVTENGGRLIKTPRSTMEDNQFNSEVNLKLDADGGAKAKVKILCTGGYRFDVIGYSALKVDEQKEWMTNLLNLKQPSVFDYNPSADKNDVKEVDMNLEYDKFCDVMAGDKQFYRPHVFDLVAFTVPVEEKRNSDYYFEHPMQKSCVTTIDLPQGFEVETLPINQALKFTYGNYEVTYTYDAAKNQVISIAKFNLTNHVIPAAKYTEMQQYLDAIVKAQNKKLVIRRKA